MVKIEFTIEGDVIAAAQAVISFRVEKGLYVPYTKASGTVWFDGELDAETVRKIKVIFDDKVLHLGMPDKVSAVRYGDKTKVVFTSMGYTLLLCQNEPYPEINTEVDLGGLIRKNIDMPLIGYESDTPMEDYIYVKEKSTIWDAVVAYGIKATGNYPYIRGANKVYVTLWECQSVDFSDRRIISQGSGIDTSSVLSEIYMKDINGEYDFTEVFPEAEGLGIVRKKYYPLDYQWLYSPQEGLEAKLNYYGRQLSERSVVYSGYSGEDLMDRAVGCGGMSDMRINYICVWGNRKGVFTKLKAYRDSYGQR